MQKIKLANTETADITKVPILGHCYGGTDQEIRNELIRKINACKHFFVHSMGATEEMVVADPFVFHVKMRNGGRFVYPDLEKIKGSENTSPVMDLVGY
jgi:hypothetical protein